MEISKFHLQVLNGEKCPYCKSGTKVKPANEIYLQLVGVDLVVVCRNHPECFSYTHAYPNSTKPHGRLLSRSDMRKRVKAYERFNHLVLSKGYMTKEEALNELAEHLEVPLEYAEICYLNGKNCMRAETWAIKKAYHFQYKATGKFAVPMTSRNGKRKRITVIEQTGPHTSIVEFDEDEKRMEINSDKIFYYKPK